MFVHLNLDDQEIAIQGYDPVAYLEDNRAKKAVLSLHTNTREWFTTTLLRKTLLFLKNHPTNTFPNTVDGVRMQWEIMEKKYPSIQNRFW